MTRIKENERWECKGCGYIAKQPELLTADSPFRINETLTACPVCRQCTDGFDCICDQEGCVKTAGCGWPTGNNDDEWGGYRSTCFEHSCYAKPAIGEE